MYFYPSFSLSALFGFRRNFGIAAAVRDSSRAPALPPGRAFEVPSFCPSAKTRFKLASYRSSIIHFVSTETKPPRSEQISASRVEKNGRINCAYFLNKTSFYSGSLLRAESRWTTTTAKKKRKMRNRKGRAEEASRSSWRIERNRGERKRGKKRGDEINNFPEFKVFCRRHFSLVSTRLRAREKEREGERALCRLFFFCS